MEMVQLFDALFCLYFVSGRKHLLRTFAYEHAYAEHNDEVLLADDEMKWH